MIKRRQSPDLSTNLFLNAPTMKTFCQQYNGMTLSGIHRRFMDQDRISAITIKEKALSWPEGQDVYRLLHILKVNNEYKQYVRSVFVDDSGIMIFYAYHDQLKLLGSFESFEVVITDKRSGAFKEVTFMRYLQEYGKVITLLRVLIDKDSPASYKVLFQRVFKLVSDVCEEPTRFHYLHGIGIKSIVIDMCPKQMTGLGMCLMGLDPQHRDWKWQLKSIVIFSPVQFLRNISKLAPDPDELNVSERMRALLSCETRQEYDFVISFIQQFGSPKTRDWAEHKKNPVIAAGICKAYSLMIPEFYQEVRDQTNGIREAHYRSYLKGAYPDVRATIYGSMDIDKRGIEQYLAQSRPRTQNSRESGNVDLPDCVEVVRKRKRTSTLQHPDAANDSPQPSDPVIDRWIGDVIQATSRSRSPSRRRSDGRPR
ncbi:predicted protein [Aspergillus terreus NIH2624]|uniref:MULE transposase domain-containing protein n=1 Tax=Aspergillus terreus (strain NIH 2624 / FGSC A1156) TaxID=341663 RepID=Q0CPM1_ASPTN|nr:uncharacterized protein ATEG_04363 [Aspergillus terreus NIH2624]EAU34810.1 predicted protein [Aspergillus terreus NIH2624]